ncbi:MAG TPA: hypothetical protein VF401_02620 [Candidatus Saccharimonadales bacterium]
MARKILNHGALLENGQGMLLPPAEVPDGATLLLAPEAESSFFQDPELADRVSRLEYEAKALKNFVAACEATGSIIDAQKITEGVQDFDDDILPVIFRRNTSIKTRQRLAKLVPKINFAHSIGIEPETLVSRDPETGEIAEGSRIEVVAKDRPVTRELNRRYKVFEDRYSGIKNREARDVRRQAISTEIKSLQLGTLATRSS